MAIIDLGKVSITWKGAYAGGTAYTPKDAVVYNNASYICIANTTGNLPTDTTYWNVMAAKGVDGTDLTSTLTAQGDILYRDGSGLQKLAAGTSGYFLKTQGTGANPVWAESSGAWQKLGEVEHTGSSVASVDVNFTPDDSVYKWYKLYITDMRGNGGEPRWRVKIGGSTHTSSQYSSGGYGVANQGNGNTWSDTRRNDTNNSMWHLDQTWTIHTSADRGQSWDINFYKASSSTSKQFFGQHQIIHDGPAYVGTGIMGWSLDNQSALTGFTIFLSSGNLTNVNAYVLGFKA